MLAAEMIRPSLLLLAAISLGIASAAAQNAAPVVKTPVADMTVYAGAPSRSIDLRTAFEDPDLTPGIRLQTTFGAIDIALFQRQKPITVANFLRYVDENRYFMTDPTTNQLASSFIHRLAPDFVLQGGGFIGTVDPQTGVYLDATPVSTLPKIQNEPGISNTRGTMAMAKIPATDSNGNPIPGGGPDSATSQWFINLEDNAHRVVDGQDVGLDVQNGGFAVFARVVGSGMDVADHIGTVPVYDGSPYNSAFDSIPLHDLGSQHYIAVRNLVSLPAITHLGSVHSPLTFSAASDDAAVATVTVSDSNLLVSGKAVGTAHVTVTATDVDGAAISQTFNVNVTELPGHFANISTRLQVGTDQNVLIAGFIVRGGASKRLLVRGIGPSLTNNGQPLPGRLADPILELHDATGIVAANDNWADDKKQQILDTGIAPTSSQESAILTQLPSSSDGIGYTAVLKGVNGGTGIGTIEVYDLDSGPGSSLLNVSTRGQVGTDANVLIAGVIITGQDSKRVLVRGIGPSLSSSGVATPLANPTIELHDANGTQIDANDDWQSSPQAADIQATGAQPTNPKESAILKTLAPSAYTAVIRGVANTTGIGAIEVYQL